MVNCFFVGLFLPLTEVIGIFKKSKEQVPKKHEKKAKHHS